jgi:hypothetical protein
MKLIIECFFQWFWCNDIKNKKNIYLIKKYHITKHKQRWTGPGNYYSKPMEIPIYPYYNYI